MPAPPQDAVIRGRTLAERRAERDRVESYPPEKLAQNVARAKKEARLKEQREEREEDARRAKRQEDMNAPLWKVWGLLRPTLASAFKDEFEMTLMLAICIVRYVELRLQTQVTRTLFGTLNSRNRAVFNQGILRSTYLSVGAAILDQRLRTPTQTSQPRPPVCDAQSFRRSSELRKLRRFSCDLHPLAGRARRTARARHRARCRAILSNPQAVRTPAGMSSSVRPQRLGCAAAPPAASPAQRPSATVRSEGSGYMNMYTVDGCVPRSEVRSSP